MLHLLALTQPHPRLRLGRCGASIGEREATPLPSFSACSSFSPCCSEFCLGPPLLFLPVRPSSSLTSLLNSSRPSFSFSLSLLTSLAAVQTQAISALGNCSQVKVAYHPGVDAWLAVIAFSVRHNSTPPSPVRAQSHSDPSPSTSPSPSLSPSTSSVSSHSSSLSFTVILPATRSFLPMS